MEPWLIHGKVFLCTWLWQVFCSEMQMQGWLPLILHPHPLRFTLVAFTLQTMATVRWLYRFFNLDFTPLSSEWTFHIDSDNWALILKDLRNSRLWRTFVSKYQTSAICRVDSNINRISFCVGWMGGRLVCNSYLTPIYMCN